MKRILIVDDAKFMRMMIRDAIEKNSEGSYEIIGEAENGLQAVAQYKALKPDIVTMDITMPECDGIEAVKQIRAFDSKAKIMMVSAMGQQLMVMEAIQAGAKDFVVKPFEKNKIMESLEKLSV